MTPCKLNKSTSLHIRNLAKNIISLKKDYITAPEQIMSTLLVQHQFEPVGYIEFACTTNGEDTKGEVIFFSK